MMTLIFLAMTVSFVFCIVQKYHLSIVCFFLSFALSFFYFLDMIHDKNSGFQMPWIQTFAPQLESREKTLW
jgi:hypothetical protein